MAAPLDEAHALTHAGSLLSADGLIVAPYDLEVSNDAVSGFSALPPFIHRAPFVADYDHARHVHLINAFGVTLGDSIIGLTALFALARRYPHVSFTVHRPARAPRYVQRLYELAAPFAGEIVDLPLPLAALSDDALNIDIGNHLFWPSFASMPMIDFFLWAMGIAPESVAAQDKCNRWLRGLPLPKAAQDDYVLLCADASTPVRSIPMAARERIVERLWNVYGLPVLGFGKVDHPRYRDIAAQSRDTAAFLAWVGGAQHVVTCDTAALHIAAGFDVPTTAFFTTIAPELRARDYARCVSIDLGLTHLQGMHASAREADLNAVERAFRSFDFDTMPLAQAATFSRI